MKRLALLLLAVNTTCASGPSAVTATIGPEGGTIQTSNGLSLDIPQGALASTTTITLTPLSPSQLAAPGTIAGVRLEPDGLQFKVAATLKVPLPEAFPLQSPPAELEFKTDPANAYPTGRTVELSPDGKTAIFKVTHFSGRICASNCHAGTREYLRAKFAERGCCGAEMDRLVTAKFPTVKLPTSCDMLGETAVQAMLDTYFDDVAGFDADDAIPSNVVPSLIAHLNSGRNVVIAFKQNVFGQREANGFYRAVAHTAAIEMHNGEYQIRNAVVAGPQVLAALGGTNLAWWPLKDLDGFRKAYQGVGVEMQACGKPGCLGPDGIDPGDPKYIYLPLSTRMVPWNALRIYVEKSSHACSGRDLKPAACTSTDGGGGTTPCELGKVCRWCLGGTVTYSGQTPPNNNGAETVKGTVMTVWASDTSIYEASLTLAGAAKDWKNLPYTSVSCPSFTSMMTSVPSQNRTVLEVTTSAGLGNSFHNGDGGYIFADCTLRTIVDGPQISGTVVLNGNNGSKAEGTFLGTFVTDGGSCVY